MKIAFFIPKITNIGGIARVVSLLSSELIDKKKFDVSVIGYLNGESEGYNWNKEIAFMSLFKKPINLKKGLLLASYRLRKKIKNNDIDVLVCCGSMLGPVGVLAILGTKTKMIYWDHSNFFEQTNHDFKMFSKKFAARHADVVVPLTKADAKEYENHTKAKEICQIYNPVDPKLNDFPTKYDPSSKKIISVGRLSTQKNFELLVDIANVVFKKDPDVTWHIYGEGHTRSAIEKKIDEYGIQDRLILEGMSSNLYSIYNEFSMMVMTSKYEGFPMVLLEGLSNGLPLISFDIKTGPNEIIVEGENGFLIEEGNVDKMAKTIVTLMSDQESRIKMSSKGLSYIKNFEIEEILDKWSKLFYSLKN